MRGHRYKRKLILWSILAARPQIDLNTKNPLSELLSKNSTSDLKKEVSISLSVEFILDANEFMTARAADTQDLGQQ